MYLIKIKNLPVSICLLAMFATFCFSGPIKPSSQDAKDDFGKIVSLSKPPERMIVLSGTTIDEFYALGVGDRMVGVLDNVCKNYPATCRKYPALAGLPNVGSWSNPNIEVIVNLKPDLIIAYDSEDRPGQYTAALKKTGIPFAAFTTVNNTAYGLQQLQKMGALLSRQKEAAALVYQINREMDSLTKAIAIHSKDKPKVFYWWGTRNGTYGKRAAVNELIERAGGSSITAEFDKQYFEASTEFIVDKNPDVIVYSYWEENQINARKDELMHRPGLASVSAIKNGRVYPIDGHILHTVLLFPEALKTMNHYFHPLQN